MKHTKQKAITMRRLASELALSEGRKHQASVGDVREILALLSDMIWRDFMSARRTLLYSTLLKNGKRRSQARKPKRKCKGRK